MERIYAPNLEPILSTVLGVYYLLNKASVMKDTCNCDILIWDDYKGFWDLHGLGI